MKVLSVVFLALPVAAFGRTQSVPTLPSPEFADTEVSACHPLNQLGEAVNRLNFHLDFNGTPFNNVEVAALIDALPCSRGCLHELPHF